MKIRMFCLVRWRLVMVQGQLAQNHGLKMCSFPHEPSLHKILFNSTEGADDLRELCKCGYDHQAKEREWVPWLTSSPNPRTNKQARMFVQKGLDPQYTDMFSRSTCSLHSWIWPQIVFLMPWRLNKVRVHSLLHKSQWAEILSKQNFTRKFCIIFDCLPFH